MPSSPPLRCSLRFHSSVCRRKARSRHAPIPTPPARESRARPRQRPEPAALPGGRQPLHPRRERGRHGSSVLKRLSDTGWMRVQSKSGRKLGQRFHNLTIGHAGFQGRRPPRRSCAQEGRLHPRWRSIRSATPLTPTLPRTTCAPTTCFQVERHPSSSSWRTRTIHESNGKDLTGRPYLISARRFRGPRQDQPGHDQANSQPDRSTTRTLTGASSSHSAISLCRHSMRSVANDPLHMNDTVTPSSAPSHDSNPDPSHRRTRRASPRRWSRCSERRSRHGRRLSRCRGRAHRRGRRCRDWCRGGWSGRQDRGGIH